MPKNLASGTAWIRVSSKIDEVVGRVNMLAGEDYQLSFRAERERPIEFR